MNADPPPRIDLNADLGEGGSEDDALLALVSSANIACGGHTGDEASMARALESAARHGVAAGAHPSLPDREHFGRREFPVTPGQVKSWVNGQVGEFCRVAESLGIPISHVKPHGALYHLVARDEVLAAAFLDGLGAFDPAWAVYGPGDSALARVARERRRRVVAEAFADRQYRADGSLVPRGQPGAVLGDAREVARRVARLVRTGRLPEESGGEVAVEAQTVCLHGDTVGAARFLRAVREALEEAGVAVMPWTKA